ncbi:Arc family DNA-binding protein [Ensifer sp. BR816]|uniref:Arc family DNA-binding protein n=1 Tax=Rhizobium sp. (strain BR816) TaxID=1057002 RepID=UPI0012FBBD3B|nr:Arc family DNA-binding protein [Ensifer sp. BR816]
MTKTSYVDLTLSPEMKVRIAESAKKNGRSMTDEINALLESFLDGATLSPEMRAIAAELADQIAAARRK